MKIKHVTTWCSALTLTGVGALLVLHAAGVIATPSDRMAPSAAPSHDEPALLPIEIVVKPIAPDVQTIEVVPEATAAAAMPTNQSNEQRHTQTAEVHRDPSPTRGSRQRLLRYSGDRRITITRSRDLGTWLFPPSQGAAKTDVEEGGVQPIYRAVPAPSSPPLHPVVQARGSLELKGRVLIKPAVMSASIQKRPNFRAASE